MAGTRNASVLPEPVLAAASRSLPARACGIHLPWTSVMVSNPNSSLIARDVCSDSPSSENRETVACEVLSATGSMCSGSVIFSFMWVQGVMRKVCLVVIDGWGISPAQQETEPHPNLITYDAVVNASTPVMSGFVESGMAHTALTAHGTDVGLPDGLMGNSEVGHLNLGAGRVVYQDIVRIDRSIRLGTLKDQPSLDAVLKAARSRGGLHLIGLGSDGGVHSHINHLLELLLLAKAVGVHRSFVHFIADGRDTSPKSCCEYLRVLYQFFERENYGELATIVGRYYSMDRDNRAERTALGINAYTLGQGEVLGSTRLERVIGKIEERYAQGETDEFLKPIVVQEEGRLGANDVVILFNYRSDRMRQLTSALIGNQSLALNLISMTEYNKEFGINTVFPPQTMTNVLAEWLSKQGVAQAHVAETEKYPHVTFFFNGGREVPFEGEEREMVPSPRVATYDLQPEMSCLEVAGVVVSKLGQERFPFVMCNLAPPDMVGHTGCYGATVQAVERTDEAIGVIYEGCKSHGYTLFVTSDHGNAEKMMDEQNRPHTAHTTAPVPLIVTDSGIQLASGSLCDVAPTILDYMGLPIPQEMTGRSLIK